jgi:hypothetical protein
MAPSRVPVASSTLSTNAVIASSLGGDSSLKGCLPAGAIGYVFAGIKSAKQVCASGTYKVTANLSHTYQHRRRSSAIPCIMRRQRRHPSHCRGFAQPKPWYSRLFTPLIKVRFSLRDM